MDVVQVPVHIVSQSVRSIHGRDTHGYHTQRMPTHGIARPLQAPGPGTCQPTYSPTNRLGAAV